MATSAAIVTKDVSFNRIPPEIQERWKVVRDVVTGDNALRTDAYLPKLNAIDNSPENTARNNAYRMRAVWFPATQFTMEGLVGLAFHRDPTTELPKQLEYLTKDADGLGVSLYQQSQHVLANTIAIGRHGLFVDWAEALGHPVIKTYSAESIINWRYQIVDGKATLAMVVLEEEVEDEDGRYGLKMVKQWREVYLNDDGNVEVQVHRETNQGSMVQNISNRPKQPVVLATGVASDGQQVPITAVELRSRGAVLTEIPFTFVGSNNNDASIDPAPLYGMAQVNLAHFRNSADYEDSVFFCGQVQPWISGLSEQWRDFLQNPYVLDHATGEKRYTGQKMYVGSRSPLLLPQGAQFGMAQAEPNSLAKEAMDHKEQQMVKIGARMIENTKANKTATGEDNDREATTSVLALCVANVNEAYQRAITFCARFMDVAVPADGFPEAFKIQQDFVTMTANPQLMAELVKAWQSGLLAKDDVRDFYRKLGLIATERTNEEIDRDIEEEEPLGTLGLDGGDPNGNPNGPAPNGPPQPGGGGGGQPPNGQERRGQQRPPRPARGGQRPARQGASQ